VLLVDRLLDILAGRMDGSHVSGVVLVDEHRQPRNFKYMSGYVVQVDNISACMLSRGIGRLVKVLCSLTHERGQVIGLICIQSLVLSVKNIPSVHLLLIRPWTNINHDNDFIDE